jgi:DNA-binding GntR family transcriptional regulator
MGMSDPVFADGRRQLSHRVAAFVREAIMAGEFRADEYIRTESLASRLDMSATPVREALMALQSEGSVRWEPRRGFRVVPISERDVADLFEVQAFIAGELAARAAGVLDIDTVDALRSTQHKLEQAADAGDAALVDRLNHAIHRRINLAASSARLAALLRQTVQYVPLRYFGSIKGWSQASAHDHSAVFDALANRDADGARTAMSTHIRHVGELLIVHLRNRPVGFDAH